MFDSTLLQIQNDRPRDKTLTCERLRVPAPAIRSLHQLAII